MRTVLAIALGTMLSFGAALADDMTPMSIDQMKAEIIGNSLSGKTEGGDHVGFTRIDGSPEPTATLIEGMAPELK